MTEDELRVPGSPRLRADAVQAGHRVVCRDGETRSIHRICTLRDGFGTIEVTFTDTLKSVYEPDEIIVLDRTTGTGL